MLSWSTNTDTYNVGLSVLTAFLITILHFDGLCFDLISFSLDIFSLFNLLFFCFFEGTWVSLLSWWLTTFNCKTSHKTARKAKKIGHLLELYQPVPSDLPAAWPLPLMNFLPLNSFRCQSWRTTFQPALLVPCQNTDVWKGNLPGEPSDIEPQKPPADRESSS